MRIWHLDQDNSNGINLRILMIFLLDTNYMDIIGRNYMLIKIILLFLERLYISIIMLSTCRCSRELLCFLHSSNNYISLNKSQLYNKFSLTGIKASFYHHDIISEETFV